MSNLPWKECNESLNVHKKWQIHFEQLLILFSYKIFNKYDFSKKKKNIARNTSKTKTFWSFNTNVKSWTQNVIVVSKILQMNEIWWFAFLNEEPLKKIKINKNSPCTQQKSLTDYQRARQFSTVFPLAP